jgi:hypothetical protein
MGDQYLAGLPPLSDARQRCGVIDLFSIGAHKSARG